MIAGTAIQELILLLERRGVSLFHACQYLDFCSYLKMGGIPSRALLEQGQDRFTPFETDFHDRQNGVWDKVFVNLLDFGESFARGRRAVPNPYGPIVLQLRPSALNTASDVAVCLRSAGAADFNREREALPRIEDIDEVFLHPLEVGFPWSTYLKTGHEAHSGIGMPEVSCTVVQGFLPISNVIVVWIDPYVFRERLLYDWVKDALNRTDTTFRLRERSCQADRRALYSELLSLLQVTTPTLHCIIQDQSCSPALRNWAMDIQSRGLDYQFQRYSRYLVAGTIRPLTGLG